METNVQTMNLEKYVREMRHKGLVKETASDYITLCPECYQRHVKEGKPNYRKLKLYVDRDLQYSHCFVCNSVYLDDNTLKTGIKTFEPEISSRDWKLCKLGNDGYWSLDKFETFDEYDEIGIDYLAKKRYYLYKQMYKLFGIRFKDHNPVIPFYYKGELIFYQMRLIDPNSRIKYFTPPTEFKNPYILEHGDNKKFVICEGTFDAIACRILFPDRTPFAVLGSNITSYQIEMLRTYLPEDILVYMDKTELSRNIMRTIQSKINYVDIHIHESDGMDPEEFMKMKLTMES